jgi:hypothetical protein
MNQVILHFSLHFVQFGFVILKTVGLKNETFTTDRFQYSHKMVILMLILILFFSQRFKIYFCHEIQISATNLNFWHKISPTDSRDHTGPEGWLLQKSSSHTILELLNFCILIFLCTVFWTSGLTPTGKCRKRWGPYSHSFQCTHLILRFSWGYFTSQDL